MRITALCREDSAIASAARLHEDSSVDKAGHCVRRRLATDVIARGQAARREDRTGDERLDQIDCQATQSLRPSPRSVFFLVSKQLPDLLGCCRGLGTLTGPRGSKGRPVSFTLAEV